jgi:hypothetical protein
VGRFVREWIGRGIRGGVGLLEGKEAVGEDERTRTPENSARERKDISNCGHGGNSTTTTTN